MSNSNKYRHGIQFLVLSAMILPCLACTTTLSIDSAIPRPVVERAPINVGVYYNATLRDYKLQDNSTLDSSDWIIELGPAQVQLFDQLLQTMFQTVVTVNDLESASNVPGIGVLIEPSIEECILDSPAKTGGEFYEVTIRYNLAFYSPSGKLLNHWLFEGHGRSRSAFFSIKESVEKATVEAMRDAAAIVVTELTNRPEVNGSLEARQTDHEQKHEDQDS
jgi:hypothetical protein